MPPEPKYATVQEAKAHRALAGTNASDDQIGAQLAAVEQRIEKATDVAWVPRQTVEHLEGDGSSTLRLSRLRCRELVNVTIDGDEQDLADFTLTRSGRLSRRTGFAAGADIEVTYLHGADAPPSDLLDAALRATGTLLGSAGNPRIGERTTELVAEGRTINFAALPDYERGRPFGMPDVDTVIMSHAIHRVMVG